MNYYLSIEEFKKFWKISLTNNNSYTARKDNWETNYKDKFKLEYIETPHNNVPGFYGVLTGSEHHITMFLLQL